MDPSRNAALQSSKLRALLSTSPSTMPSHPPPSYHMVVDPNAPIPNMRSPYDAEEVEKEDTEEEIPEVTINATTQIRGHGNIISVPPMDAVRIAGLLHTMMFGPPQLPSPTLSPQQQPLGVHREYQSSPPSQPQQPQQQHQRQNLGTTHATVQTGLKSMPKINITVNCGATVVGDKNIVGPGLGDIVRHMQIRNQMAAAQAQVQAHAQAAKAAHAQHHMSMPVPILTPMRSRRGSEESESSTGSKRRSEDEAEGSPQSKRTHIGGH